MIILVILTIAKIAESNDATQSPPIGDLQPEIEQLDGETHNKLLPLWPNRKYVSLTHVGKKILNMSNMLGELLKEDKLKLENINNIKAETKAGMLDLALLEQRCRYREKVVRDSIKRNVELLDKLRSFVKEKEKFDSQLSSEFNVLSREFIPPNGEFQKKKSTSNLIFVMPDRLGKTS